MADTHLNFGLTNEEHLLAKDVKELMKANNWHDCFMDLIAAENKRRSS